MFTVILTAPAVIQESRFPDMADMSGYRNTGHAIPAYPMPTDPHGMV